MTVAFEGLSISAVLLEILVGLGFVVVTFLMGMLIQSCGITFLSQEEKSLSNVFVLGFLFTVAISQFLIVLPSLDCIKVMSATILWWSVFFVLSAISIIRCKGDIVDIISIIPLRIRGFLKKKGGGVYGILSITLIVVQLILSIILYHYDDDDFIYVTTVASNITENKFWHIYGPTGEPTHLWEMAQYLTNGWYDFLTIVCKSTNLPAAVLMHTILPPFMIALAYAAVFVFAKILIDNESQRYLFLVFVSIINVLNNVSTHTSSSTLLMRMHQGKAIFANLVIPVMFCIFFLMWKQAENRKLLWILILANTAACAFSTSGLIFGAILTAIFALVFAVYNQSVKKGFLTLLTIIPNVVFAAIYVIERLFEVWGC